MKWHTPIAFLVILTMLASGCVRLSLRDEVFSSQPLWESSKLLQLKQASINKNRLNQSATPEVYLDEAPGLAMLVHQVLGRDLKVSTNPTKSYVDVSNDNERSFQGLVLQKQDIGTKAQMEFTEARTASVKSFGTSRSIAFDSTPLHPSLASLSLTKAIVRSMEVAYLRANGNTSAKIEDSKLWRSDFEDFANKAVKTTLALDRDAPREAADGKDIGEGIDRTQRLALAEEAKKVTLDGLLMAYLTAYYNGEFVDRTGGTSQKPKIGLTITNETITAVIHVMVEALADYAITDSEKFRVPIIYEGTDTTEDPTFINASKQRPTLATYIMKLNGSKAPYLKHVIEPRVENDQIGISSEKLGYIRYASGLAADSSQALSGSLMRLIGGANIGFGILGKFSFGDNETLSKIIDTLVEGMTRRATEAFASHLLYGIKIPKGMSVPECLGKEVNCSI